MQVRVEDILRSNRSGRGARGSEFSAYRTIVDTPELSATSQLDVDAYFLLRYSLQGSQVSKQLPEVVIIS